MQTLVIDTSYGSTVGVVGHEPIVETDSRTHVEKLQVNIAQAVEQAGLQASDITRIVVGVGPAPFTGLRAGIVAESELPEIIVKRLGTRNSRRINSLVDNIIRTSSAGNVGISDDMQEVWDVFHEFLYDRVYHNPVAKGEEAKVENILRGIWEHYCRYPEKLPEDLRGIMERDGH